MGEQRHTPTPWTANGRKIVSHCISAYGKPCDVLIAQMRRTDLHREDDANARHIVKCVNAHERLKNAVESVIAYMTNPNTAEPATVCNKLIAAARAIDVDEDVIDAIAMSLLKADADAVSIDASTNSDAEGK